MMGWDGQFNKAACGGNGDSTPPLEMSSKPTDAQLHALTLVPWKEKKDTKPFEILDVLVLKS